MAVVEVKYIFKNTVLEKNTVNRTFQKFMSFIDNMLLFSSLERNHYQGFKTGSDKIAEGIIKANKLEDFEEFLKSNGIKYNLVAEDVNGQLKILCKFKKKTVDFYSIASKGTSSLSLFYYWLIQLDKVPFVLIDEFDAFYHSSVSRSVVEGFLRVIDYGFFTHRKPVLLN